MKGRPELTQVVEIIREFQSFAIASHEEPEGDCLGASLALTHHLISMGKDVHVYNVDGVPWKYRFLDGAELVRRDIPSKPVDVLFVLDSSALSRLGKHHEQLVQQAKRVVNIDHHVSNTQFGDINIIDATVSCTGELVYELLSQTGHRVDGAQYACLLCAIVTDTGSFRYVNTTSMAFQIAAEAVAVGVKPWTIAQGMYERNRLPRIQALAQALRAMEVSQCGRWCVMPIRLSMLQETGATRADIEGFVNYARSIDGVEVAILIREDAPDMQKISLRSKGGVDVTRLAVAFGGGGHHNAAACKMAMTFEESKAMLVEAVSHKFIEGA